ncbi:MAG: urea carboxylase-associated family protein, partial [Pseudomonadota bacterium]
MSEEILIQGGAADGLLLAEGDQFRITNLEGSQVVDLWAFVQPGIAEYLSTEHTRSCLQKLVPGVGDTLYTNQRRSVLTMVEDTSPGVHDMLLSACDERRYELLGHDGYHKNCADNLRHTAGEHGHTLEDVPSP